LLILLSARAARGLTADLSGVLHGVHHLQEAHRLVLSADDLAGLDHRSLHVRSRALAARVVRRGRLSGLLVSASRLLAHKLALGARAERGLLALPVALGLLAHRGADGVGCSAGRAALCRRADGLALGAVSGLAQILRAADVALRLVAVDLACSARGLLAMNLALRALAHRVALSRARRIVALPAALRVARSSLCLRLHLHSRDRARKEQGEHRKQNERSLHF